MKKTKKWFKKSLVKGIKILLKKKKNKKREYSCEQYKNLSEDKKQRLVEYIKVYYKMQKNKKLLQTLKEGFKLSIDSNVPKN